MSSSTINNTMAILLIAFAVVLIGGLIVIPAIQEAQAVKGEAARHISSEGERHMSDQGARAAGVCSSCG